MNANLNVNQNVNVNVNVNDDDGTRTSRRSHSQTTVLDQKQHSHRNNRNHPKTSEGDCGAGLATAASATATASLSEARVSIDHPIEQVDANEELGLLDSRAGKGQSSSSNSGNSELEKTSSHQSSSLWQFLFPFLSWDCLASEKHVSKIGQIVVPLLLLGNIAMFLVSNTGKIASIVANVDLAGTKLDLTLIEFSLGASPEAP